MQRSDSGFWLYPTGWADIGYSPAEVALKEVREETGIECEVVGLLGVLDGMRRGFTRVPLYSLLFHCRATGGDLAAHPLECLDVGFFSLDALPEPLAGSPNLWEHAAAALRGEALAAYFDPPRDEPWQAPLGVGGRTPSAVGSGRRRSGTLVAVVRRRLLPILLLLSGCGPAQLADAVPLPAPAPSSDLGAHDDRRPTRRDDHAAPRPAPDRAGGGGWRLRQRPDRPVERGRHRPRRRSSTIPAGTTRPVPCPPAVGSIPSGPATWPPSPRIPGSGTVEGHLTVQFTPDLPIDRVELRLWANSPRIAAAGGAHRGRLAQR